MQSVPGVPLTVGRGSLAFGPQQGKASCLRGRRTRWRVARHGVHVRPQTPTSMATAHADTHGCLQAPKYFPCYHGLRGCVGVNALHLYHSSRCVEQPK